MIDDLASVHVLRSCVEAFGASLLGVVPLLLV